MQAERLRDQGYHLVGNHSAVKTCHWTNRCVRDEDECYKGGFYGVRSHRCVQMTPVVTDCTQRCLFCWRDQTVDATPDWDDPADVAEGTLEAHRDLTVGYKGSPDAVPRELFDEAMDPKHVALSLAGEPTLYPRLPELVEEFHGRGLTTFLVTNGTRPGAVEEVEPTQLYLSVDAPDPETYEELCRPKSAELWNRFRETLDVVGEKGCRTAVRITLVRGINDEAAAFAPLVEQADPDFVEVKAYMHVGHSRERLRRSRMPRHADVVEFAGELSRCLDGYEPVDEVERSRVVLLTISGTERRYLDPG
ncbi:MAG: S-adenosyl-L-methionine-dependent tRNA 4-demethylwyosine synthase [Methanonatronarchaeales archaeon]|nr:S-adenosyl-L-methionine-dependent tRNA 4-demethylwyosine synthase [Methanonatronarchaeales archaeon]